MKNRILRICVFAALSALLVLIVVGPSIAVSDQLPAAWSGIDIGNASPQGSSNATDDSTFTLNGGGHAYSGFNDAFHFVYMGSSGDCTIIAHVQLNPSSSSTAPTTAEAGLMCRQELCSNSNFVAATLDARQQASAGVRTDFEPASMVTSLPPAQEVANASWLRLIRQGGYVQAFVAAGDGSAPGDWAAIGRPQPIDSGMAFIGLYATSGSAGTPATAQFDHVSMHSGADTRLSTGFPDLNETKYQQQPNSMSNANVPHGETITFNMVSKKYYPGNASQVQVYVPKEYSPDKPACMVVELDGLGYDIGNIIDNLVYKKEMPVTIAVGVPSGGIAALDKTTARYNRCFEYDSTNDRFDRFLFDEVLPLVEQQQTSDGRAIHISMDPNDHMIFGSSSGGVCAFTAAWEHPDLFRRVFTAIGTYVGMRGADEYPTLIRKTEPKPIRIFMQDGAADSWNRLFDDWYTQNRSMEQSLQWAGYDVNHNWGVLGHEGSQAEMLLPSAMVWLWRDYPAPITAGTSPNSMQQAILVNGESWQPVDGAESISPAALTTDPAGDIFCVNAGTDTIYKLMPGAAATVFAKAGAPVAAEAFGPDGKLYASLPSKHQIVAISPDGKRSVFASGIAAGHTTVLSDGTIFVSEPGAHDDMPSTIWRIDPSGKKTMLDTGIHNAAGILVTGNHHEVFVAEGNTHWIFSYELLDGSLQDKQRYYWLHTAESADEDADDSAGTSDIAEDAGGFVWAATRMGVQVCDMNGRVEAILTLPDGPITSLTFGGKSLDTVYVVCGGKIYSRHVNVHGQPGFAAIVKLPDWGAG